MHALLKDRLELGQAPIPLLDVALTHRSYTFEHPGLVSNERLEFLGDAVLGLVVTDMIFAWYPDLQEGDLAKLRSGCVNMSALAGIARGIGLGGELLVGKGEQLSGGRDKDSILADCLEAVLGAVYLDCGLDQVRVLIGRLFGPLIRAEFSRGVLRDFKTSLQEKVARLFGTVPDYRVTGAGPDHNRSFEARVYIAGNLLGTGSGRSKKLAEQAAAFQALSDPAFDPAAGGARAT